MDIMVPKSLPIPPSIVPSPTERMNSLFSKSKIDPDSSIPIKLYCNAFSQINRMANIHFDDRNFEKAFILYHKYINLFMEILPKHPEYSKISEKDLSIYKNRSYIIIEMLEQIKNKHLLPTYNQDYERYLVSKRAYEAQLKLYNDNQKSLAEKQSEQQSQDRIDRLQKEFDRKRTQLSDPKFAVAEISKPKPPSHDNSTGIDIDSLPDVPLDDLDIETSSEDENYSDKSLQPLPSAPPLPDRSSKPANLLSELSDKDELTKMIVPFKALTQIFMKIASSNTLKNIETCAILAGKLSQNCFTITCLIVPKQIGTSDTCSATNEEELFIEQEKRELLTVGWIHTHPTQKAFLSSVDLHTHAPYQKMLPEAIAIVIAPKFDEIGLYSLSEYGLEYILKCKQTGFHPHPNESKIYGRADHVIINDDLDVNLIDFR